MTDANREIVIQLWIDGYHPLYIAKLTGLSIYEIKKIVKDIKRSIK